MMSTNWPGAFAPLIAALALALGPGTGDMYGQEATAMVVPSSMFHSGVDLVALTVTAERPDGSYVPRLQPGDFRVFEEGVPQHVAFFGAGEVPVDLVLMLDTSGSMGARLGVAKQAAINLINASGVEDRTVLMAFGTRADVVVPFTADRALLEQAIQRLQAAGHTALYDAIYVALREFGGAPAGDFRRRAIVVFSDGDDTRSLVSFESVIDQARRTGVAIYVIAPQRATPRDHRPLDGAMYEMRRLADETGGRSFFPDALQDLEGIYGTIARELAHQYVIGYVPESTERNKFRRVSVVVDQPGVKVRTRSGYIAGE
jgi:Ca-activated chloride channel family protein